MMVLVLPLLLEPIVLQPQLTEIPTLPCSLPVAAVPADAHRCYSEFLAAAAVPVAADVAADPVHTAPSAAISPCLLQPLMLRIDVTIRRGEFLARSRRPLCYCYRWSCWCCRLHAACLGCCCCHCRCWSRLFCNPRSPKICSNASPDTRLWTKGPLTSVPGTIIEPVSNTISSSACRNGALSAASADATQRRFHSRR